MRRSWDSLIFIMGDFWYCQDDIFILKRTWTNSIKWSKCLQTAFSKTFYCKIFFLFRFKSHCSLFLGISADDKSSLIAIKALCRCILFYVTIHTSACEQFVQNFKQMQWVTWTTQFLKGHDRLWPDAGWIYGEWKIYPDAVIQRT